MPLCGAPRTYFGAVGLSLGNRNSPVWQIPSEKACDYLDRIGEFQRSSSARELAGLTNPTGLFIAGTEPFSQVDDLDRLLDCAVQNHMMVEVVTTVCWVDSESSVDAVLDRLGKKLHLLTVFTSRSDIDRYEIERLERLLLAARRANISTSVRCGVGPDEPFPKELLALEVLNSDTSVVRIEPLGNFSAGAQWPKAFLLASPPRHCRCAELMGFVIVPGGDVYPCSGGVGLPQLRLGNLETQGVEEILQHATSRADLRRLRNEGPYFLYEACRESPHSGMLPQGFVSSCQFHRFVLSNGPLAEIAAAAGAPTLENRPSASSGFVPWENYISIRSC
jgi:radical SAM protein with 4Fe4S-binding SPASM domain